jgi:shikimate dehydrogenase
VADVLFVGVATGGSFVHRAMPLWQPLLRRECRIRGVDLPPNAPDEAYRELIEDLRRDQGAAGAVVTSHKVRLFEAARELFAELDPVALACREVNAVRRGGAGVHGYARDPISVGRVLDAIWPSPERAGDVICLGAGGTARALAYHLFATATPPRFTCADRNPGALDLLVGLTGGRLDPHLGEGPWDDLVAAAPPGSLLVNATGMGKDRPGSPTSDRVRFPPTSVVWELNYRGELAFLRQARAQAEPAGLRVHDGWQLFCHGWAAALTAVLELPDDAGLGDRFSEAARSRSAPRPANPPAG